MKNSIDQLNILKDRIFLVQAQIYGIEVMGPDHCEVELQDLEAMLVEMRELEQELRIDFEKEKPDSEPVWQQQKTFDAIYDQRIYPQTGQIYNRFSYLPVVKNTTNEMVVYMGRDGEDESQYTILPSVYIGASLDSLNRAIAYIRCHYPDLVIEKRESTKFEEYPLELKLTNCYYHQVSSLVNMDWLNPPISPEGELKFCPQEYHQEDGIVIYGNEAEGYTATFSFSNKSKMRKWLNFLRRGRSLSGESSFLAGAVVQLVENLTKPERLCPKGKHQMFILGLTLSQVESLLLFDFNIEMNSQVSSELFTYGDRLNPEQEKELIAHSTVNPNY